MKYALIRRNKELTSSKKKTN